MKATGEAEKLITTSTEELHLKVDELNEQINGLIGTQGEARVRMREDELIQSRHNNDLRLKFRLDRNLCLSHFSFDRRVPIGWGGQARVYGGLHISGMQVALKEIPVLEHSNEYKIHTACHGHKNIVKMLGKFSGSHGNVEK